MFPLHKTIVFIVPLLVFSFLAAARLTLPGFQGTTDSIAYLQSAESFKTTGNFVYESCYGLEIPAGQKQRLSLWPIGYSLLIAIFSFGGNYYTCSLYLSIFMTIAALCLILDFYSREISPIAAVWAGTMTAIVLFPYAATAMSEGPHLFFSTASIWLIYRTINHSERKITPYVFLFAGMMAGFSWTIRNMSAALFAAVVMYLAVRCFLRQNEKIRSKVWTQLLVWLLGWGAASFYQVFYNFYYFGNFNPYKMPPSSRSFWQNCMDYIFALGGPFLDCLQTYWLVLYPHKMTALLLFGTLCILGFILYEISFHREDWKDRCKQYIRYIKTHQYFHFFLFLYALGIAGIAILARTIYEQGHMMDSRMIFPIAWIKYFFLAIGFQRGINSLFPKKNYRYLLWTALFILSLAAPVQMFCWHFPFEKQKLARPAYENLTQYVPKNQYVLSFDAPEVTFWGHVSCKSLRKADISSEEMMKIQKEGKMWGVIVTEPVNDFLSQWKCEESKENLILPMIKGEKMEWYRKIEISPGMTAFQYVGPTECGEKKEKF